MNNNALSIQSTLSTMTYGFNVLNYWILYANLLLLLHPYAKNCPHVLSYYESNTVNLFNPDNAIFLATSIPNALSPYNNTLAYDYFITDSNPITPMYLDIRFYTSAELVSNYLYSMYYSLTSTTSIGVSINSYRLYLHFNLPYSYALLNWYYDLRLWLMLTTFF